MVERYREEVLERYWEEVEEVERYQVEEVVVEHENRPLIEKPLPCFWCSMWEKAQLCLYSLSFAYLTFPSRKRTEVVFKDV